MALKHDLEYFHSIVIINYEKCLRMKLARDSLSRNLNAELIVLTVEFHVCK